MTMTVPRIARRLARSPFRCPAVLRRQTPGMRNDFGEFVPGVVLELDVQVVRAPIDGEERRVLPEGLREEDVTTFWMVDQVEPVDEAIEGHGGDHLVVDGAVYQVRMVKPWPGGWYEVVGVEMRPGA